MRPVAPRAPLASAPVVPPAAAAIWDHTRSDAFTTLTPRGLTLPVARTFVTHSALCAADTITTFPRVFLKSVRVCLFQTPVRMTIRIRPTDVPVLDQSPEPRFTAVPAQFVETQASLLVSVVFGPRRDPLNTSPIAGACAVPFAVPET